MKGQYKSKAMEFYKKIIDDLNGCFTNDGNARFIHYEGAGKLLEQFRKEIELEILTDVQMGFKIQSDLSTKTLGYKGLCGQIEHLTKQQ